MLTVCKEAITKGIAWPRAHIRSNSPPRSTSAAAGSNSARIDRINYQTHVKQLENAFRNVEKQLDRMKGIETQYAHLSPAKRSEFEITQTTLQKLEVATTELTNVINELNELPPEDKLIVIKRFKMEFAGLTKQFTFSTAQAYLVGSPTTPSIITKFFTEINQIRSIDAQLGATSNIELIQTLQHEKGQDAKPAVTILCPLMIDGMGDLGIAMNALDALQDEMQGADVKLVVMLATGHATSEENRKKVTQMIQGNPHIEVVEIPFSYQTGTAGSPAKADSENREKLQQILGRTDVLLNLPVDYKNHLQEVRTMMPKASKVIVSTEYGLRREAQAPKNVDEFQRIESGPGQIVYLNEGKLSQDEIVRTLKGNDDIRQIIPHVDHAMTSTEAIGSYSSDHNLSIFYLNKDTPLPTTRLFLEQYLDIHRDDARNLDILGNIPLDILRDKEFQKKLVKKYGISNLVIQEKGKPPENLRLSRKPGKPLTIYSGFSFPKATFRALSEFSVLTSRGYPNLMFAAGDGSFTDALSLMINYSQNPDAPDFVPSIPVFITRLSFHEKSVQELIQLCEDIGEPKLKELFEKLAYFKNMKQIPEDEVQKLSALMKSESVSVGLARLAQKIRYEHNFSRTIKNSVETAMHEVVVARRAERASTSDSGAL